MFSKYKKPGVPVAGAMQTTGQRPVAPAPKPDGPSLMKAMPQRRPAEAGPADKDKRRKDRLQELKLDLHKSLLENLNLAALESATEQELRTEINAIANETLEEMGVVLSREERQTLSQDLFF